MAPNYHPLSLCLLDFVFIWWNPELINFICMHKVHTQMLSFLGQQLRQYHNTKKSNLTSFLTHWALLLVFTKDHIWDLQQEKVKIYKKKRILSLVLKLCAHKADFVGVLEFVKKLFMNCKDYDWLLLFSFSLLSSFYHRPWRGVPGNLQSPGRVLHIMHITEEICRQSGQVWDYKVLSLCRHQQTVRCHSLCCIIEGLKGKVSNGKGVQEEYNSPGL